MAVLSDRDARFAEHLAVFDDPAAAYLASGHVDTTKRQSIQRAAYRIMSKPQVRNRITELRNAIAAKGPHLQKAALVRELEEASQVDTREIADLVIHHCPVCYSSPAYARWWPNACLAAAMQGQDLPPDPTAPDEFASDRPPWSECASCAGAGRPVTHWANFSELSPAARRLVRGVELHSDGGLKRVLIADQSAIREQLHRTVPGFNAPATSVNINANLDLKPLKRGMSIDEAMQILETLSPATDPDPTVVCEQ